MFKRPDPILSKGFPLEMQRMFLFPRGEAEDTWFLAWSCQDVLYVRVEAYVHAGDLPAHETLTQAFRGAAVFALQQGKPGDALPIQLDPNAKFFYLGGAIGSTAWMDAWSDAEQQNLLTGLCGTVWTGRDGQGRSWSEVRAFRAVLPTPTAANLPMKKTEW